MVAAVMAAMAMVAVAAAGMTSMKIDSTGCQ
jgi:hypothetical protein